jgi:hypothetical protein
MRTNWKKQVEAECAAKLGLELEVAKLRRELFALELEYDKDSYPCGEFTARIKQLEEALRAMQCDCFTQQLKRVQNGKQKRLNKGITHKKEEVTARIKELGFTLTELLYVLVVWVLIVGGGAVGWIMNIVKLCNYTTMDAHTLIRIVGVFTFIPGAIMGYMNF